MPGIKVLVIGECRLLVEAIGSALTAQHEVEMVGTYPDVDLALERVRDIRPDMALLDNSFAQLDVVRYAARLRDACPKLRIVVLTRIVDRLTLLAYVLAGVDGHLTLERSLADLIHSIKQVHDGQVLFPPDQLVSLLTQPPAQPIPKPLAPREVEVLQVLGTGVRTEQAAVELAMSVHTLRTHLKHAMRKLQAHSKLEAVLIAYKAGLIELPS